MSKFRGYDLGQMFLGDTEIGKAYLGNTLVFQKYIPKPNYFWSEAIASGTFTLTIASSVSTSMLEYVSYSTDDGETWTKTDNVDNTVVTITTPTIAAGGKVLWKGVGTKYASNFSNGTFSTFTGSANHNIGGDIGTLFYGDEYRGNFDSIASFGLHKFFRNDTKLINAKDLILSPKKVNSDRIYQDTFNGCSNLETAPRILAEEATGYYVMFAMFSGCKKLVVAPELLFTRVGSGSQQNMFSGCTGLTTPPSELKATSITTGSYYGMFSGCSNLTSVPDIKATSVSYSNCMREMFYGCSKITTAPVLRMTTLSQNCLYRMFYNCTSLNYIKMMATDISASNCLYQWVSGVAASGTFVKNSSASWTTTGVSGVPDGWTVTTASS